MVDLLANSLTRSKQALSKDSFEYTYLCQEFLHCDKKKKKTRF